MSNFVGGGGHCGHVPDLLQLFFKVPFFKILLKGVENNVKMPSNFTLFSTPLSNIYMMTDNYFLFI